MAAAGVCVLAAHSGTGEQKAVMRGHHLQCLPLCQPEILLAW